MIVVCKSIPFLGSVGTGTSVSISGGSLVFSDNNRIMVSVPSRLRGHVKKYKLFELLCASRYDVNLGFLADSHSFQADWSRCELL